MSNKSSILSPKYAKKKRRQMWAKWLFVGVLVFIIVLSVSFISGLPSQRIESVEVLGTSVIPEKEIIALAKNALAGDYLYLFPRDNVFLFSKEKVRQAVRDAYLRLDDVSVATKDWNTLVVTVVEKKPLGLWCEGVPLATENCFFIESSGLVFAKAPDFSGNVFLRYYGALAEMHYLPEGQFAAVDLFLKEITKNEITVIALLAKGEGEFEITFKNKASASPGKILFNNRISYSKTLENLLTIWKEKIDTAQSPLPVDYIDLRYGNKVYFKVQ